MPEWYRQKAQAVQAHRWNPDDMAAAAAVVAWLEVNGQPCTIGEDAHLVVPPVGGAGGTTRAVQEAWEGDWVLRSEERGFWVLTADAFTALYELVT